MAENARGGSYRRVFLGRDGIKKAEEYINKFEIDTHDKFCVAKSENFKIIDGPLLALVNKKIFWEENSSNTIAVLYDGVPFIVIGKQRRECFHGPDRNLGKKKKEMKRKKTDHPYGEKGRKLVQPSHKMNCPAVIMLRYIIKFPQYKIHSNSTYQRKRQGQQLKADIQNNTPITVEHQIYCSLPNDTDHQFHVRGEFGSTFQPVDKSLISKINALVAEGVRSVSEMKRHLTIFTKQNFPTVSELSNRFYPSNKAIRNHMYKALKLDQYSDEDQENLRHRAI